jgi:hypothetical protein
LLGGITDSGWSCFTTSNLPAASSRRPKQRYQVLQRSSGSALSHVKTTLVENLRNGELRRTLCITHL